MRPHQTSPHKENEPKNRKSLLLLLKTHISYRIYIYIDRFARDVDLAGKQTAQHIYKYLILYAAHTYTYHVYSRMCIGLCRIRSFILRSQLFVGRRQFYFGIA